MGDASAEPGTAWMLGVGRDCGGVCRRASSCVSPRPGPAPMQLGRTACAPTNSTIGNPLRRAARRVARPLVRGRSALARLRAVLASLRRRDSLHSKLSAGLQQQLRRSYAATAVHRFQQPKAAKAEGFAVCNKDAGVEMLWLILMTRHLIYGRLGVGVLRCETRS